MIDVAKEDASGWKAYGSALAAYRQGDFAGAKELLGTLLRTSPGFADAHNLLGICQLGLNELVQAAGSIRSALQLDERADFHANFGLVMLRSGDLEAAADAYRSSLRIGPPSADICSNLGNILSGSKRYEEAAEYYRQATKLRPEEAQGFLTLGTCLFRLNRREEAEAALRSAVELDPSRLDARRKLADLLIETGRFPEAFELYRTAGAWGWLQFGMRSYVAWNGLDAVDAAYLEEAARGPRIPTSPWCVIQMPGMTPELERRIAHDFAIKSVPDLKTRPLCPPSTVATAGRRLRIGYLSADFYSHATMYLLAGVLESHDRTGFDVRLFSYGPQRDDECAGRLQAMGLPIEDISAVSDRDAARRIFAQRIDVLVDLKGHTGSARPGITALRPAPIVVNWLGHPGTLGHPGLADYIIGDPVITPPADAGFYSERLALMPYCYQPNDRTRPLPPCPSRAEAGLPDSGLVFCSFNQPVKFNPRTFDIWARLLEAVPGSLLWLLEPKSRSMRVNMLREFRARGIGSERIVFAPNVAQPDHIARLRLADVALDTFPCTSHTTGSDALWAGVPLVTLKGKTFSSRVAASLLATHGFPELITETEADYFGVALDLARDERSRMALRTRLDQARLRSPLFDTQRFTRDLERLYLGIVEDHNNRVQGGEGAGRC